MHMRIPESEPHNASRALHAHSPDHANALIRFAKPPIVLKDNVTASDMPPLYDHYSEQLLGEVQDSEIAAVTLFHSTDSLEHDVGLWSFLLAHAPSAVREEHYAMLDVLDRARPTVDLAPHYGHMVEQLAAGQPLGRCAMIGNGFLRSLRDGVNKGSMHSLNELDLGTTPASLALITAHELLVQRIDALETHISPRADSLLSYSAVRRLISEKRFAHINEAYDYIANVHAGSIYEVRPILREALQQGLVSTLQCASLFPDIVTAFEDDNEAAFCAMIQSITRHLPSVGWLGPKGQSGVVFNKGLLQYSEDGTVNLSPRLIDAFGKKPIVRRITFDPYDMRQVLCIGKHMVGVFVPLALPESTEDSSDIPGTIQFIPGSLDNPIMVNAACPALAIHKAVPNKRSVVSLTASALYQQAKAVEKRILTEQATPEITTLTHAEMLAMTSNEAFKKLISAEELATWGGVDPTSLPGGLTNELAMTFLSETVPLTLRALGRKVLTQLYVDRSAIQVSM